MPTNLVVVSKTVRKYFATKSGVLFLKFGTLYCIVVCIVIKFLNVLVWGTTFVQETSAAYARMSFDLEEVRSIMLNYFSVELVRDLLLSALTWRWTDACYHDDGVMTMMITSNKRSK